MQDVIRRYLDCWNETDPAARRKLIEEVWAPGATYTDPLAEVSGRAAIDATITAAQGQFPGFVFTLAGPVDAHHRQARFSWNLGPAGAEPVVVGFRRRADRARWPDHRGVRLPGPGAGRLIPGIGQCRRCAIADTVLYAMAHRLH
jgi:hypothetical protein